MLTPDKLLAVLSPLYAAARAGWRAGDRSPQVDLEEALVEGWPYIAAWLERLAAAEADADQLAAELSQHGYGDFHYTGPDYRDKSVLHALALHDEAVARRSQP